MGTFDLHFKIVVYNNKLRIYHVIIQDSICFP